MIKKLSNEKLQKLAEGTKKVAQSIDFSSIPELPQVSGGMEPEDLVNDTIEITKSIAKGATRLVGMAIPGANAVLGVSAMKDVQNKVMQKTMQVMKTGLTQGLRRSMAPSIKQTAKQSISQTAKPSPKPSFKPS